MDWAQFQTVVAHVEELLAPAADVKCPDELPDLDTGQMREVDASIRTQVGSTAVLIIVECRKRKHKQDVTWIEALASKRDSVGAHMVIAVSSRGFSKPAEEKARLKRIELRRLDEITAEEGAQRLLAGLRITLEETPYEFFWPTLFRSDGGILGRAELAPSLLEALQADPLNAPLLYMLPNRQSYSIHQLLALAPTPDVPVGGKRVAATARVECPSGRVVVQTASGEEPLSALHIPVTFRRFLKSVPLLTLHEYSRPGGTIMAIAEGHVVLGDGTPAQLEVFLDPRTPAGASPGEPAGRSDEPLRGRIWLSVPPRPRTGLD